MIFLLTHARSTIRLRTLVFVSLSLDLFYRINIFRVNYGKLMHFTYKAKETCAHIYFDVTLHQTSSVINVVNGGEQEREPLECEVTTVLSIFTIS